MHTGTGKPKAGLAAKCIGWQAGLQEQQASIPLLACSWEDAFDKANS